MVKALQMLLDNDLAGITVVQEFERLLVGEPDSQRLLSGLSQARRRGQVAILG
jgi:hypothetical protein